MKVWRSEYRRESLKKRMSSNLAGTGRIGTRTRSSLASSSCFVKRMMYDIDEEDVSTHIDTSNRKIR
jgi:hypothetical protein